MLKERRVECQVWIGAELYLLVLVRTSAEDWHSVCFHSLSCLALRPLLLCLFLSHFIIISALHFLTLLFTPPPPSFVYAPFNRNECMTDRRGKCTTLTTNSAIFFPFLNPSEMRYKPVANNQRSCPPCHYPVWLGPEEFAISESRSLHFVQSLVDPTGESVCEMERRRHWLRTQWASKSIAQHCAIFHTHSSARQSMRAEGGGCAWSRTARDTQRMPHLLIDLPLSHCSFKSIVLPYSLA